MFVNSIFKKIVEVNKELTVPEVVDDFSKRVDLSVDDVISSEEVKLLPEVAGNGQGLVQDLSLELQYRKLSEGEV